MPLGHGADTLTPSQTLLHVTEQMLSNLPKISVITGNRTKPDGSVTSHTW